MEQQDARILNLKKRKKKKKVLDIMDWTIRSRLQRNSCRTQLQTGYIGGWARKPILSSFILVTKTRSCFVSIFLFVKNSISISLVFCSAMKIKERVNHNIWTHCRKKVHAWRVSTIFLMLYASEQRSLIMRSSMPAYKNCHIYPKYSYVNNREIVLNQIKCFVTIYDIHEMHIK